MLIQISPPVPPSVAPEMMLVLDKDEEIPKIEDVKDMLRKAAKFLPLETIQIPHIHLETKK